MNKKIKKAFVIGHPIAQSKSPVIHNYWCDQYNTDARYDAHDISISALPDFISAMREDRTTFSGGNVTIPHKEAIISLVDELDETARRIGAVNTIYRKDDRLIGSNTDAYGFTANLDSRETFWRNGETAIVLGAGGACRAILFALCQTNYKTIYLLNRTQSRAEKLAAEFNVGSDDPIKVVPFDELQNVMKGADLFVNTTSLGMSTNSDPANAAQVPQLDFSVMSPKALVTDIVYAPLITPFLKQADAQGLKTIDGLGMLLHQAVPGFEHWFGQRPDVTDELRQLVLKQMDLINA